MRVYFRERFHLASGVWCFVSSAPCFVISSVGQQLLPWWGRRDKDEEGRREGGRVNERNGCSVEHSVRWVPGAQLHALWNSEGIARLGIITVYNAHLFSISVALYILLITSASSILEHMYHSPLPHILNNTTMNESLSKNQTHICLLSTWHINSTMKNW